MYVKQAVHSFFGKPAGDRLIGAAKGIGRVLDEPLFNAALGAVAPELGMGLAAAKRAGVLEKLKHVDDY